MSEMVERVAGIIAAEIMELTTEQRANFQFPDDANGDTCDRARSAARAALAAMREPTEGMLSAAGHASDGSGDVWAGDVWQTMIDEALK